MIVPISDEENEKILKSAASPTQNDKLTTQIALGNPEIERAEGLGRDDTGTIFEISKALCSKTTETSDFSFLKRLRFAQPLSWWSTLGPKAKLLTKIMLADVTLSRNSSLRKSPLTSLYSLWLLPHHFIQRLK
jgi:hypothetical protein